MARKICMLIGYAQSPSKGTSIPPNRINSVTGTPVDILPSVPAPNVRGLELFGHPTAGLMSAGTPGSIGTTGMFSLLRDAIAARTQLEVMLINRAQGNTGAVDAWVGYNATTSGLRVPGETGLYDPAGWIDKLVGSAQIAYNLGYEIWVFTQDHHNDVAAQRPTQLVIDASVHIQNRVKAVCPTTVFVGRSTRTIASDIQAYANESAWDAGGKIEQIANGVVSAIPGAYLGANLSDMTDSNYYARDSQAFIHPNHAGHCVAANRWLQRLITLGVI